MFFILYDIYIFKSKQNILDKLTRCYLLGKPYSLNKDNTIKETNLSKSQIIESDSSFYMNSMELNEQMRNEKQRETIKPKVFKTKIKIVWFLFVILSLYPIHNILSYFFADYYNLSNYHLAENHYNEKASSNFFRKAYEKRNRFWNEFPKEKFGVSGFSRLVCACKSRIKCCKSVHEEPDVSHAPKLGPESFYLGIE